MHLRKSSENCEKPLSNLDYYNNFLYRDEQYTKLLDQYVKNQKFLNIAQLVFKYFFFFIVCLVFIGVIAAGACGIYFISQKDNITWQDIGAALAGLGSILSVIIVLPSKIAEHLFPATGDKESLEFIKSMQSYDQSINVDETDGDAILDGELVLNVGKGCQSQQIADETNIQSEEHVSKGM